MGESFLNARVALHCGDCRSVLATLAPDSIDAVVTDPPYHLTSTVERFGAEDAAPPRFRTGAYGGGFKEANGGTGAAFARMSRGFMGKVWDGGDIAFRPETWRAVFRVLKPGAHLVACGGTRTYHRMACAIEDAGFEIRDTISWLYGSGFPKSHDVSKGIDRAAGEQRERIRGVRSGVVQSVYAQDAWSKEYKDSVLSSEPITDAARQWQGWGTALKPACELIVLARKPLSEPTVAANVLRWGTGAINVDGCRVATDDGYQDNAVTQGINTAQTSYVPAVARRTFEPATNGRWPANLAHDGSDEVTAAFPEVNNKTGGPSPSSIGANETYGGGKPWVPVGYADTGSAARFFYTAKANQDDRLGSRHPTVKPLDLMQWLVRLVTPKGGVVLDPFAGTGTTGEAAWREGMRAVLIEAEPEYQADIRRRMGLALAGPDERNRESIKAKNLPVDYGPLFGFPEAAE